MEKAKTAAAGRGRCKANPMRSLEDLIFMF